MCDQEKNTCENCLSDILEVIIKLQRRGQKFDDIKEGCDKPFLGPMSILFALTTRDRFAYSVAAMVDFGHYHTEQMAQLVVFSGLKI